LRALPNNTVLDSEKFILPVAGPTSLAFDVANGVGVEIFGEDGSSLSIISESKKRY
jgi:hypothetical protein